MLKKDRIERVLAELENMGMSQILIVDPMTIYYLTGVYQQPMERFYALYLSAKSEPVFFLNFLFHVPEDLDIKKVWHSDTDNPVAMVAEVVDHDCVLGVDKDLKVRFLLPLMEMGAATGFKNASLAVDLTRAIKNEDEKALMREASRVNDVAIERFKALIHEGVTEKEVADQTMAIYKELGAQEFSFPPIVSFGANAADPHHEPDDTVLKAGDCVLFDVGCVKDGYCSDMTRTFYYKSVDDHAKEVYETVLAANLAAEALIKPGVEICKLDAAARDLITEKGYGPYFNHRLGHFIGLTDHEFGDVSLTTTWIAKPGMIFSIEPGIYLKDDTGVRIEDLVLVTEDGVEILNKYPKELEIIE